MSFQCFKVYGKADEKWVLCGPEPNTCPGGWKEGIATILGQKYEGCYEEIEVVDSSDIYI